MKTTLFCIVAAIAVSHCGCEKYPYDEAALTYKGKFVFDNQFRMDGIYTCERYADKNVYLYMYFFRNGMCCDIGIENPDENFFSSCIEIWPNARDIPYFWGCFIVEDNILKVQTYDPSTRPRHREFQVEEMWAEIVNDTTLHFFREVNSEGKKGKTRDLDETYHFRHCENKPDSMNVLMR